MEIKKHFCSLSEAIREGAKLNPQSTRLYIQVGCTCAWGAAVQATRALNGDPLFKGSDSGICDAVEQLERVYRYVKEKARCPACSQAKTLNDAVHHLNDRHKWTREAIADWLESEEEKLGYITLTEKEETHETKTIAASAGNRALQLP